MKALFIITLIAGVLGSGCFVNVSWYTAPDGSTIYVGDFYDDTGGPGFYGSEIQGKVYDAEGILIDTAGGFLCSGVYAGGIVPFSAWTGANTVPARVEWSIVDPPEDPFLATGLEAEVTNTFVGGDFTYIVGELTNASSNVYLAASRICVSFTDAEGRVVRSAWNNGGAWKLNPGDTLPFSVPVHTPPPGSDMHLYLDANFILDSGSRAVEIPIEALSHSSQATLPDGDLFVTTGMGEVKNDDVRPTYPDAVASIVNRSGKLLATRGDPSDCGVTIAPGASGFVTYTVKAGVSAVPAVQLQGFQTGSPVYFPAVSGVEFEADRDADTIAVTGTVTNTSGATVAFGGVCVGGYDSSGIVRAVASASLELPEDGLAPGASASFSVTLPDNGVMRVKAIADGFPGE